MTSKNNTHVYFMPGMCANSMIFERIELSSNFKSHYLDWIPPLKNESLSNYVIRLSKNIKHENSILIGVSFGGIIVQELSKILKIKKIIIISSVKSNKELSNSMKFAKKTKSYKLLPVTWLNDFESLLAFVLGPKIKRKVNLYRKYLSVRDENYLKWAIKEMINWKQEDPMDDVIHIHGTFDLVFPVMNIKNYIPLKRGDHTMILKRADWLNDYFLKNLN
jgi:pimeloyl-ACP methyl ester carboxylesterase|tara:strand:- start:2390 stop:3049 length:660 start_codon:yes stop_codon:yes gene_type:complete